MTSTIEKVKQPKSTQQKTEENQKVTNLAASWYVAMLSKELGKKPITIEIFGKSLVAWRDENDHPVIMELYCSHLGASLAMGTVVDGCIQCPFHHWRFDGSGQCVSAPAVDRIPPTARQGTYPTTERYGYIWVWYGSEIPLFPLPECPSAESGKHNYMPLRFVYNTKTTVRMLVENACDYYHVITLHGQKVSGSIQLSLFDDEHTAQQKEAPINQEAWDALQQGKAPVPEEAWFGALIQYPLASYVGRLGPVAEALGLGAKAFTARVDSWSGGTRVTNYTDAEERLTVLFSATPIADNNTTAHFLVMVRKTGNFWLDMLYLLLFSWQSKTAFGKEDIPIFNNLDTDAGKAYVKHDRGILKFREFYQRWVNKIE
ncbi:MAG: Rieske 2Fe-2S domain-containing protein [Nostoc sp. DedQUE12b]|uniref:Rieske 2Fe-2S domain-containing protein n=1 Tax=Nostoc sp. DedQUE12b TaxID=3075398 RepID=UPI002AD3760F|nr:Rieske 2Fe-2S domain-containing protein [Nostoc sp. DedQUE12b]MDZ8084402.1 Rieske 2Fe-2S domain-containing protein [Nostoc sp. DedQUE12b]